MLGVLCSRPKPWIHVSPSLSLTSPAAHHRRRRLAGTSVTFFGVGGQQPRPRHHSSSCRLSTSTGCASIWHAILPSGRRCQWPHFHHDQMKGEGSWNVAWDARPARWLHRPDSAWLLFGVCACLALPIECDDVASPTSGTSAVDVHFEGCGNNVVTYETIEGSAKYRVTGVKADGRCLFRAIAHVACLRGGEDAPDENRQRELADNLRAQVVDELQRRRKETEWFIEEDFDAYLGRIQQPYVWGGEPELLMASHVLRTPISVLMVDKSSGRLTMVANYGEEYQKDGEDPITILFHGYGHYDILDKVWDQSESEVEV